ncbi:MAG: GDSL-type esterase/lipase family protein, partial [Verrucomicrobiota bacterium]
MPRTIFLLALTLLIPAVSPHAEVKPLGNKVNDAKNEKIEAPEVVEDPELAQYAIYAESAPRAEAAEPLETSLPLELSKGLRIGLVGNTLWDRSMHFGFFESALHQAFPEKELVVRNLSWSADEIDLQPRPDNFADAEQHLFHEKVDLILAAFGFNESFAGPEGISPFRERLRAYLQRTKALGFNGETGPQFVLLSPTANENVEGAAAADWNNENLRLYADAMQEIASQEGVGFVDLFDPTLGVTGLTENGCHLTAAGYETFAAAMMKALFGMEVPDVSEELRAMVIDKNAQYYRRYRPVNTFYYTGGRKKSYGYLDFLPAMRNFGVMTENRDRAIWALARGESVSLVDDSNVPEMPPTKMGRGANEWMTAAEEQEAFLLDDRFEVSLWAGEEEFPDIAAPIQMRWDSEGRLWVACSTTYPHLYPGQEPNDKIVILEDTDGDGKADTSSVWADDLHIPLSFEFGDGGVYVSEEPDLTFLKDTDG